MQEIEKCFDEDDCCFDATDGECIWCNRKAGTSRNTYVGRKVKFWILYFICGVTACTALFVSLGSVEIANQSLLKAQRSLVLAKQAEDNAKAAYQDAALKFKTRKIIDEFQEGKK